MDNRSREHARNVPHGVDDRGLSRAVADSTGIAT